MPNQTSKPVQGKKRTPFFLVEEFNATNPEHFSGHLTIKMNPAHAYDLCELIAEIELDPDEGHILAMISQIRRWYKTRKAALRSGPPTVVQKDVVSDGVMQELVVDKTNIIVNNSSC